MTYPEGIVELYPDHKTSDKLSYNIKLNEEISQKSIIDNLNFQNFTRVDFVKEPGEYAVRGSIIDVYSFTNNNPIRIESDDDLIIKIKEFDSESQLTVKSLEGVKLLSNIQRDKNSKNYVSLLDFISDDWWVWCDDLSLCANIIDDKFDESTKIY
ncbi:MAG: hypothetical protein ACJZZG_03745, partial [Cytophagales bacterium]